MGGGGVRHGVYHSHVRAHSGICVKQVILTSLRMVGVERVFLIYWEPILSGVCVRCVNIMYYEGAGYVCVYTLCLWG